MILAVECSTRFEKDLEEERIRKNWIEIKMTGLVNQTNWLFRDHAECRRWLRSSIVGLCYMPREDRPIFYFELEEDAVLFKLTWM